MKKYLLLLIGLVGLLASCSDEKTLALPTVHSGDEILFGAALPGDVASRTIYGDEVTMEEGVKTFPVYWKSNDEIAVFSPEAANPPHKWAKYKVHVNDERPSSAAEAVQRLGDCGLQWGNLQEPHRFFGLYPAKLVADGTQNWLAGSFIANMPLKQNPAGIKYANGKYTVLPDMDNALMYAYSMVNPLEVGNETPVNLPFKPLATAVDITVNGPEDVDEIFITGITIKSESNKNIAGKFKVVIGEEGTVTCTAVGKGQGQEEYAGTSINIPLNVFSEEGGSSTSTGIKSNGILLKKGETLNAKAFLIPDETVLNDANLKIIVSLLNGHKTKTLPQTAKIEPNKVVRVNLPKLNTNNASTSWISELDPNIYVTELSLPGSKMSMLTKEHVDEDGKNLIVYQQATIREQLEAGVRAFILQTQIQELPGMKFDLRVSCNGKDVGKLKEVVETIATFMKDKGTALDKKEYAFVMVTYANTGKSISGKTLPDYWHNFGKPWNYQDKIWAETYLNEVSEMAKAPQTYALYTEEITAETTIQQVANHVVLKLNYNNDRMKDVLNRKQPIPSLMTLWTSPYVENGVNMQWGNPRNNSSNLQWLYQEVTTVSPTKNRSWYEATRGEKEKYIQAIFEKSVTAYANGAHNIWFMNDLGGAYCEGESFSKITKSDSRTLTKDMNALALKLLSERTEDASLGLVFMNFADRSSKEAKQYKSDVLIQSVIDNNFKFALRKAAGKSPAVRSSVSKAVQEDPNVWDNE